MFTNDTLNPLNEKAQILLYADYITIITHHKDRWALRRELTSEITNIENYQAKWLIQTNKNKSNIVSYKQHIRKMQGQPAIRINGEIIPCTNSTRILGVTFDNDLKFKKTHRPKNATGKIYKIQTTKI